MSKEAMKLALKKAFQLGQDYWYQADHDSYRENKKSDETLAKFRQLVDETCEALAEQPAPMAEPCKQEPVACAYKATTKKGETAHFGEYSAAKAWAGWGTVEQVPLKTLTLVQKSIQPCSTCEALARAVMLDQTSHDAQRKPLTETEIRTLRSDLAGTLDVQYVTFARAIEAAHGIKGEA